MPYSVIAKQRAGYAGFRRAGFFFRSDQPTILSDEEMTDEILAEPMLIVTPVAAPEADEILAEPMLIVTPVAAPEADETPGNETPEEETPETDKAPSADTDQCQAKTGAGAQCKNDALPGSEFCRVHQPKE